MFYPTNLSQILYLGVFGSRIMNYDIKMLVVSPLLVTFDLPVQVVLKFAPVLFFGGVIPNYDIEIVNICDLL